MLLFEFLAERKIAEAIAKGELDNLPGSGRPLDLDDDALVPEDLRMAHRILKNAGMAPPEIGVLRELADLERCLHLLGEGEVRSAAVRKVELLRAGIEARGSRSSLGAGGPYAARVLRRFGG
jgi:hypothetical protein